MFDTSFTTNVSLVAKEVVTTPLPSRNSISRSANTPKYSHYIDILNFSITQFLMIVAN